MTTGNEHAKILFADCCTNLLPLAHIKMNCTVLSAYPDHDHHFFALCSSSISSWWFDDDRNNVVVMMVLKNEYQQSILCMQCDNKIPLHLISYSIPFITKKRRQDKNQEKISFVHSTRIHMSMTMMEWGQLIFVALLHTHWLCELFLLEKCYKT